MDVFQIKRQMQHALGEKPGETPSVLVQRRFRQSQEAMEAADAALGLTLPPELQWLRRLESDTAASLLGTVEAIEAFARLHLDEGHLYLQRGDIACADTKYWRALELLLEVVARNPDQGSDALDLVYELSDRLDPAGLPDLYQGRLRRLRAH